MTLIMTLKEVSTRRDRKDFYDAARILYKNDPVWVCPLEKEIESVFDPLKNTFFRHGKAVRFVLYDEGKNPAGRIAAFIDFNSSALQEQPTGGIGFFECVNNREAANRLFDTARAWLKQSGMEAMDGPVNFGETDKYWGLLVEGFTHPSYEIAYNHPYYRELFENYGFKTYYRQEGFHLDVKKPLPERFLKVAEWIANKPDYTFRHFEWKQADRYIHDFVEVYNEAWASFKDNFKPMEAAYVKKTLQKAKAIIDPEFIWLAYFKGKPIAIYLMWPDVNLILKHLNGRLTPLSLVKFLYLKKKKAITRARGVLMGVIPAFQGKGVESGIILKVAGVMKSKPQYTEIEFSWVGDFNPKMRKIFIGVGSESVKHYITYRYLFDRTKEFKRFPIPEE
jgi:hypothetical protein